MLSGYDAATNPHSLPNFTPMNTTRGPFRYTAALLFLTALFLLENSYAQETSNQDDANLPSEDGEPIEELEEFSVEEKAAANSRLAIMDERRESSGIVDTISSEDFTRTGAGNAADSMSKVVGANIVDGKYVVIRGLGDRYSNTLLNGSVLPSADPDKKAVQLDMVPTGLLDSIETTKSFTPDKPGDFTGGSVDVATKSFPEERTFTMSGAVVFEQGTTANSEFLSNPERKLDFWGRSGDQLPSTVPNTEDFPARRDRREEENGAIRNEASSGLSEFALFPVKGAPGPGSSFSIAYGDSHNFRDKRLGYIFSFTRSHDFSHKDDIRDEIWTFAEGDAFVPRRGYDKIESSEEISWGALSNIAFAVSPEHEISFTAIFNENSEDKIGYRFNGFDRNRGVELDDLNETSLTNYDIGYSNRSLRSFQIKGKHKFKNWNNFAVDWLASSSNSEEDRPGNRGIIAQVSSDGELGYLLNQADQNLPQVFFRNIEADRHLFQVNAVLPFNNLFQGTDFKAGYLFTKSDRLAQQRLFKFFRGRSPILDFSSFSDLPAAIDQNSDVSRTQQNQAQWEDLTFRDPNNIANYDGNEEIESYYLMADTKLTQRLRFTAGARYESTALGVNAIGSTGQLNSLSQDTGTLEEADILPAAHLVYHMGKEKNMNLRFSYGRTLARPTYREIAPFRTTDFVTIEVFEGNPNLERTLVDNFDLRWEWYLSRSEVIAVTYFTKNMENPIVPTVRFSNQLFFSWSNAQKGTVSGIEFEFRKRIKNLTFTGNFALIDSSIEAEISGANFTSAFEGQPNYIVNFDIGYDNQFWGTSMNLLFNAVGESLSFLSLEVDPDIYQDASYSLDFNLTQRVWGKWKLRFAVNNLLQSQWRQSYLGQDQTFRSYSENRAFKLGISRDF